MCTTALCAWLVAAVPSAHAQRLNLDGPSHLSGGECAAVLKLADAVDPTGMPDGDPAAKARRAVRSLAAELIRVSERSTPPTSRNLVLGMTIAARIPLLDAAIDRTDPALLTAAIKDIQAAIAGIKSDPDTVALAVRDALAPLTDSVATPSDQSPWDCATSVQTQVDILGLLRSGSGGIAESMAALDRRLNAAAGSAAYAPSVAAARRRIAAAAALAMKPPPWLPASARQAAITHLADAIARTVSEPQSPETLRRLERLALLGRIAFGLEGQRGAAATRAQQSLARLASVGPVEDPTLRDAERRKLFAIAGAAELLTQRDAGRDERSLVRQFRPALRTMLELAKFTESDLLEVLPEALDSPSGDAINDPKFIAAVAAHKRRLDDLGAIIGASASILHAQGAPPVPNADPAAREEYKLLGDRLLTYAKDALDLAQRNDPLVRDRLEQALSRVRGLAADARDFAELPGEPELRAGPGKHAPDLAALLGDAATPLLAQLDADRNAWLKGWGSPDKAPVETGTRLRRLHELMLMVGDAAEVERLRTSGAAVRWPGWEMSPATLATLAEGLNDSLLDTIKAHTAKGADVPSRSADLIDRFAPVLLTGRLSRVLPPCGDPMTELTAGPPPADAPMFDRLADLAMICRESHELAARTARKEEISRLRLAVKSLAVPCWRDAPRPAATPTATPTP